MKIMRFFFIAIFLHLLLACNGRSNEVTNLNVIDFYNIYSNDNSIQLVDVRTPEEWEKGIIDGAKQIDVTSNNFEEKSLELLDKNEPVYVYCRSGGRSQIASEILLEKGFEVYNIEGGYISWKDKYQ